MKKIGLLINPIAGMGGKVGLKGTDGKETLALARALGAQPESEKKAIQVLTSLLPLKEDLLFLTAQGEMGECSLKELGFAHQVIYKGKKESATADSLNFLEVLKTKEVDLLLFVGGDGTARDVASVIELAIPAIGVPAGVKIHSPVYATTPEAAGRLAVTYLMDSAISIDDKEVMDIEEESFREDIIKTQVYGYLSVPDDQKSLQNLKAPSLQSDHAAQTSAALQVIDFIEDDVFYLIGSGSTTACVLQELQLPATHLGIDIIKNRKLVAKDVNEQQILEIIGSESAKLILTPMGGQGFLFGRGNQQLSDKVLRHIPKEDITILSTPGKLQSLYGKPFLIYTGDTEVDRLLSGYYKVIVGYGKFAVHKAVPADSV